MDHDGHHLSEEEMRAAIRRRDPSYDGQFFYAVLTTGVFCRPVCGSRPARVENIRFFETAIMAHKAGFRPCRRCRPLDRSRDSAVLIDIAQYIEAHAEEKLTLQSLAKRAGLSPSYLQRAFKAVFGISPKAYQDAVRLKAFKGLLKQGDAVTGAIFEAGYGSTSRVYDHAVRNMGMTPSRYRAGGDGESISYACRETALGLFMMAATKRGVCFAMFGDDEAALLTLLKTEFPKAALIPSQNANSDDLNLWIDAINTHLNNAGPQPDLPLDMRGTAFQVKVWRFLLSIQDGDVMSYSEVAKALDHPKAVRAVASACGANRIGILIPCHRVLRHDGGLGGYRWGNDRKRTLLNKEKKK